MRKLKGRFRWWIASRQIPGQHSASIPSTISLEFEWKARHSKSSTPRQPFNCGQAVLTAARTREQGSSTIQEILQKRPKVLIKQDDSSPEESYDTDDNEENELIKELEDLE